MISRRQLASVIGVGIATAFGAHAFSPTKKNSVPLISKIRETRHILQAQGVEPAAEDGLFEVWLNPAEYQQVLREFKYGFGISRPENEQSVAGCRIFKASHERRGVLVVGRRGNIRIGRIMEAL